MWISPLLLENVALRMGNLQAAKTSRSGGSCVIGLWYVTGWELVVGITGCYSLWDHGNPMFCILRCSQHMLHATPNFGTIRGLLSNAEAAGANSAKYFHLLIRATAPPPVHEAEPLKDLWDLVMTRRISRYRVNMLGGSTSFRFRCTWYDRYQPVGMVRRRFCQQLAQLPRRWNEEGKSPWLSSGWWWWICFE